MPAPGPVRGLAKLSQMCSFMGEGFGADLGDGLGSGTIPADPRRERNDS